MENTLNQTEQNSAVNMPVQSQPSQSLDGRVESQVYREVEGIPIPEIIQSDKEAAKCYSNGFLSTLMALGCPRINFQEIRHSRDIRASGDERLIFLDLCQQAGGEAARREYLESSLPYTSEPLIDSGLTGIGEIRGHMDLTNIMYRIKEGRMRLY